MDGKNKIKMRCRNGIWVVSVTYYNVYVVCMADSVRSALRGLKTDMSYIEHGLSIALSRPGQFQFKVALNGDMESARVEEVKGE
jgi:hypothetical protein